jgi:hypothetical protein
VTVEGVDSKKGSPRIIVPASRFQTGTSVGDDQEAESDDADHLYEPSSYETERDVVAEAASTTMSVGEGASVWIELVVACEVMAAAAKGSF